MNDKYGKFHFKIESLLEEKSISKNKLCKDMDILRPNLNKYCRDEVQRFDTALNCIFHRPCNIWNDI